MPSTVTNLVCPSAAFWRAHPVPVPHQEQRGCCHLGQAACVCIHHLVVMGQQTLLTKRCRHLHTSV
jgi:hypothetical protein